MAHDGPPLTPKKWPKTDPYEPKMAKKRTAENFGTTYINPKSKNSCTLFSSIFQKISPFPRYGRLKSKFLCERYSHWIYSSCSIELTKTVNTWSLTASVLRCWDNEGLESWNWTDSITIFITLILFHHINMHHTGQSSSGRDLGMERLAY